MIKTIEKCPNCKERFICEKTPQNFGFRWREEMVCPYCKETIKTSLEYSFDTRKVEKNNG